jgi:hypothetical protein
MAVLEHPPATRWLSTAATGEALGLSRTTLGDLKRAGVLKPGEHWIRAGLGQGAYRWQLPAVEATLRQRAAAELEQAAA